jgi:hypothetical protein
VALAISLQVVQAHQEQEQVLAVVVAVQGAQVLVQTQLPTLAVTAVLAVAVVEQAPH